PSFPGGQARWNWTSQSYARYSDGWGAVVEVVSSENDGSMEKHNRDSFECLTTRAVRAVKK
ncbi:MAG: hypothetical protein KKA60_00550, partial [Proteobacteria bacterium]|nr:hypothetical protein [Pseudomonadota bacterium]